MNIRRFFASFRDAFRGAVYVYRHEQNFRVQLVLASLVAVLTFLLELKQYEMITIFLLIILVLILELLNSVLEKFIDLVKPRLDMQAKVMKEIAAAMTLLASFGALVIGIIIFWSHIVSFLQT